MKQRDIIIILAGAAIVLAIINIYGHPISENNVFKIPQYFKIQEDSHRSWAEKVIDDPIALFTLILTWSTFGLYLATRALWNSTENLVIGAEKTAAMQLRAYVGVQSVRVSMRDADEIPDEIILVIKNFGNTPALEYQISVAWMDEQDTVRRFQNIPQRGNPSTLMPSQTDEILLYKLRVSLSPRIVFGKIIYKDAFGIHRFNEFRYRSILGSDKFTPDLSGNASN